jgi:hypothetical protein
LSRLVIITLTAATFALLAMVVSGGLSLSSPPTGEAQALPTEPHYRCYDISPVQDPAVPVTVLDQFGSADVEVRLSRWLCAPAVKNGEGDLVDVEANWPHLKCYDIVGGNDPDRDVRLDTQFGPEEDVEIGEALELCVPVNKQVLPGAPPPPPDPGLPHWQCYDIFDNGHSAGAVADIEDQFGVTLAVPVDEASELCAPALKDGDGDLDVPHLKCYDITAAFFDPVEQVALTTQFGIEDPVDVDDAQRLCVPAIKGQVVGGIAEYPDVDASPAAADSSGGSSPPPYAAIASAAAAAAAALVAGGWFTRRRWMR